MLEALREDVLDADLVDDVVTRTVELHAAEHAGLDERRRSLEADVRRVDAELGRLADSIATGTALPSVLDAIAARERRRADLKAQLEHVDGLTRAALRDRLASWTELLMGNPGEARPVLRSLLAGRVTLTPTTRPEGRFYEFTRPPPTGRCWADSCL